MLRLILEAPLHHLALWFASISIISDSIMREIYYIYQSLNAGRYVWLFHVPLAILNSRATIWITNLSLGCYRYILLLKVFSLPSPTWQCNRVCGLGQQTRTVYCLAQHPLPEAASDILPSMRCDPADQPISARECNEGPCDGLEWVVSSWSGVSWLSLNKRSRSCVSIVFLQ